MDSDLIFGQQFAPMNANSVCALDHVVVRRSASVWRHGAEDCCVGSLLGKARASSTPVMVEFLLWLVVVGCGCSCVCCAIFVLGL